MVLSSAALRAQLTADAIGKQINYKGKINYMEELYLTDYELIINVLSLQDDTINSLFLITHNPVLFELANKLQKENISKFPTLGILALQLPIMSWKDITYEDKGKIDFFIFPKQFKYYMPKQIQVSLT